MAVASRYEVATQLSVTASRLNRSAIAGSAMFTDDDMNGVINDDRSTTNNIIPLLAESSSILRVSIIISSVRDYPLSSQHNTCSKKYIAD
jgi:hypothetical protein